MSVVWSNGVCLGGWHFIASPPALNTGMRSQQTRRAENGPRLVAPRKLSAIDQADRNHRMRPHCPASEPIGYVHIKTMTLVCPMQTTTRLRRECINECVAYTAHADFPSLLSPCAM